MIIIAFIVFIIIILAVKLPKTKTYERNVNISFPIENLRKCIEKEDKIYGDGITYYCEDVSEEDINKMEILDEQEGNLICYNGYKKYTYEFVADKENCEKIISNCTRLWETNYVISLNKPSYFNKSINDCGDGFLYFYEKIKDVGNPDISIIKLYNQEINNYFYP